MTNNRKFTNSLDFSLVGLSRAQNAPLIPDRSEQTQAPAAGSLASHLFAGGLSIHGPDDLAGLQSDRKWFDVTETAAYDPAQGALRAAPAPLHPAHSGGVARAQHIDLHQPATDMDMSFSKLDTSLLQGASLQTMHLLPAFADTDISARGDYRLALEHDAQQLQSHSPFLQPADTGGSSGGDPDGQLWFGGEGPNFGTIKNGIGDNIVGHIDSDQNGNDISDLNTDNDGLESVGIDPAAGLYFGFGTDGMLWSGHITNNTQTNEASEIQRVSMVHGTAGNADEVESFAVDPVDHILFMGLWGQADQYTGILEIQYNPSTGALTSPYNASAGQITDFNHMLLHDDNSGEIGGVSYTNAVAMDYDVSTGKLYYIDQTNGVDYGGSSGVHWNATNGIYVVNVTGGGGALLSVGASDQPTPTLLSSNTQFALGDDQNYIANFAVDDAKGLIYFTVNHATAESSTLYYMPIGGGSATAMPLPGNITFGIADYYDDGSNALALDANGQVLYLSDNYYSQTVSLTLSADGKSIVSGNNDFMVLDSDNTYPSGAGSQSAASSLYFDNLPTLNTDSHNMSGTSTEAVQGGGADIVLTGAAITVTDPDGKELGFVTVKIANAQSGDVLSANTSGTNIAASYNSTTHILTLSGEDTYTNYENVMRTVSYQDTGTDNSSGSHPTRTLDWTVSDGVTMADPTASDPNVATSTVVVDRAPTVATEGYSLLEGGIASGSSGTGGSGALEGDSDKDGDSLAISQVSGSAGNVNATINGTYGQLEIDSNGTLTYNANKNTAIDGAATGSHPVDSFTYQVSDGLGGLTTQTVTFTIDRAPTVVADNPAGQALESGSDITGNVLTNDSDKDGDSLAVSQVNGSGANVGSTINGTYGQLQLASTGSYSYSANDTSAINSATTGSHLTDTFTYQANDSHGGTTTTTVTFTLDRAPTLGADSYNVAESGSASGTSGTGGTGVLGNDSDRDGDSLTVSAVNGSGANVGSGTFQGTYGHLQLNADGSLTYHADNTGAINGAANGSHPVDTFTYTVSDGHGGTTTQNVSFTIDRPAVANNDAISTTESSTVTASTQGTGVLGNDADPDGDSFSIIAVNGSAGNVGNKITFADNSFITVNSNGTCTYDPNHAWDFLPAAASGAPSTGTETFTYTISGGATATATITINGQDSNDVLVGTAGNDTYNGGVGDDRFIDTQGGTDNLSGGAGNDVFVMGAALTAADVINGGMNNDLVELNGDYTGANALILGAGSFTSVESISFKAGHNYNTTTNDANVGPNATMHVGAGDLGSGDSLTFNGSAETDGRFILEGGAGNDNLTGGANNDTFLLQHGGNDFASGGGGNDVFDFGSAFTSADRVDGGSGTDTVVLDGDYSAGVTFSATTMVNVEKIDLSAGNSYNLTTNDANVGAGQTLRISAGNLGASDNLTFDGSAETDGSFVVRAGAGTNIITGGAGNDLLEAGSGSNTLTGGRGMDRLYAGSGQDTFVYNTVTDSTSTTHDIVNAFNASNDAFELAGTLTSVTAVDAAVTTGKLTNSHFDVDLAKFVGASQLGANHAVLFTPNSGGLAGHTYLIIDENGVAGYQAGYDLVIELTNSTSLGLSTGNFTT